MSRTVQDLKRLQAEMVSIIPPTMYPITMLLAELVDDLIVRREADEARAANSDEVVLREIGRAGIRLPKVNDSPIITMSSGGSVDTSGAPGVSVSWPPS